MGWVVNATPWLLHLAVKAQYPLYTRLAGWTGAENLVSRPHRDSIPGPSSPYAIPAPCLLIQVVFENSPPSDGFLTETWDALLVSITRATLLYRSRSVFTSRFLLRQLYAGTRRWSSPLLGLQEERDVSRMGDRYVEANGLQRHTTGRVQFLTGGISSREMAAVASHTQYGLYGQHHINDRKHMVVNVTFPFTFVPVTDNDGRKCISSHMKKVPPPPTPPNPEPL